MMPTIEEALLMENRALQARVKELERMLDVEHGLKEVYKQLEREAVERVVAARRGRDYWKYYCKWFYASRKFIIAERDRLERRLTKEAK